MKVHPGLLHTNYDAIYNKVIPPAIRKVGEEKNSTTGSEFSFRVDENKGPWERPEEIDYVSPIADNYEFACGKSYVYHKCALVATYDEYFCKISGSSLKRRHYSGNG